MYSFNSDGLLTCSQELTGATYSMARKELIGLGDTIFKSAEAEERKLKPEEKKRLGAIEAELDDVHEKIIGPIAEGWNGSGSNPARGGRTGVRTYGEIFGLRPGEMSDGGFASPDEFWKTLHSGRSDQRLDAFRGPVHALQQEGVDSRGGFFAPETLVASIFGPAIEKSIVLSRCRVEPMVSNTKKISSFYSGDHSGSSIHSGFSSAWTDEGGTLSDQTAQARQLELNAHKLALLASATNEVLEDAGNFDSVLSAAMSDALAWHLDDAFLNGTGGGMPTGVVNDPALIAITKEVSQTASTIVYSNVVKMLARLKGDLFDDAIWLANATTVPQLMEMSLAIGTGGSQVTVLQESAGKFTLFGRPIVFSEKLPTLGSQGDLILCNLSQYVVGLRRGMKIDKSAHYGFNTDSVYFRGVIRVAGFGTWDAAFSPKNGDSQSWCVAIEERA